MSHADGRAKDDRAAGRAALGFVLLFGVLSFFADFVYEGARSVLGPYLLSLQASATVVGVVAGLGELLGYTLRLASGRFADRSGRVWPITIFGYLVQMVAVPCLALAGSWPAAAALIVLERIGKALRNPPRDLMLSQAAKRVGGYGWAFGLNEGLDQLGAMAGPLLIAAVLAAGGAYRVGFALLAVPALVTLVLVGAARLLYPKPQELEPRQPAASADAPFPPVSWVYLAGAALVAAGFADYPLIAYRFGHSGAVPGEWIPIFYAVAMAVGGGGSLLAGRLFDRFGFKMLVVLTVIAAAYAPLAFLGGFGTSLAGTVIWGLGMGVHESIIPAAVAPMVPAARRASAFGLFTAGYGVAWFAGSAVIGLLADWSLPATVAFCVVAQLAAVPVFLWVGRRRA